MNPFSLEDKVAVVTGGYGVLGGSIASGLAAAGARVAILGRRRDRAERKADEIRGAGGEARSLVADVLDETQLDAARDELLGAWSRVDILVNAAGGNVTRGAQRQPTGVRGTPAMRSTRCFGSISTAPSPHRCDSAR